MPTYDYVCEKCGKEFEVFQSMNDARLETCPEGSCEGKVRRKIGTGAGVIFKGSGFYQTDYRSESYKKGESKEKSSSSSSSDSKSSDSSSSAGSDSGSKSKSESGGGGSKGSKESGGSGGGSSSSSGGSSSGGSKGE